MSLPVRIFISYARKDLEPLEALETHLSNLKRQKVIEVWTDQKLLASTEWSPELLGKPRSAQVVLVLMSPDMMASDFIHDTELTETLERHTRGEVRVVPVLVRPTDLKGHAFDKFQGLPRNFKPVVEWTNRDAAWVDVVKELRPLIEALRQGSKVDRPQITQIDTDLSSGGESRKPTRAAPPAPTPTPAQETSPQSLTLLHISDLHFGQARGEGRIHFDQRKVVSELVKDAAKMRQALGSPDAVLVTGDIAFKADPAEYRQADDWLRELAHVVGVSPEKVWLVPGNHDVDRGQATKPLMRKAVHGSLRSAPSGLDDYLLPENRDDFESSLWPKLQPYSDFARPWAAPTLSPAHPFWRQEQTSPLGKLTLVGLNSCLLSLDNTDAKANLALSKAQLHRLFEKLPEQSLTLALMHHPPDWLSDGDELLKELQKHPHLLFTGHVHTLGGGANHGLGQGGRLHLTAGAAHASPNEPGQHSYAWIRLSRDGLEWYPRVYSERWNEFRADSDRLEDGTIVQQLDAWALPKRLRDWLVAPLAAPDIQKTAPTLATAVLPPYSPRPEAHIKPGDRVALVDFRGSLTTEAQLKQFQRFTPDVQAFPLANDERDALELLKREDVDSGPVAHLCYQLEVIVAQLKDDAGTPLHLFVAGPFWTGMWLARVLDRETRFNSRIFYQFDSATQQWLRFFDAQAINAQVIDAQAHTTKDFFSESQESWPRGDSAPSIRDAVLSIEFRSVRPEELEQVLIPLEKATVFRLRPARSSTIDNAAQADAARSQILALLERIRLLLPADGRIHLLTSAPLALMMGVAEALRETVFSSILIYDYLPKAGYHPVLDLMSGFATSTGYDTFYLTEIRWSHIKRFRQTALTLPARPGWFVFAGPNASGKSTVLQSLALGLIGKSRADSIFHGEEELPQNWISRGQSEGSLSLTLHRLPPLGLKAVDFDATHTLRWRLDNGSLLSSEEATDSRNQASRPRTQQFLFLAGYGAFRRLSGHSDDAQKRARSPIGTVIGLFDERVSLAEGVVWLQELDYAGNKNVISQAIQLLNDGLLPLEQEGSTNQPLPARMELTRISPEGLWIQQRYRDGLTQEFPLQTLSDGYRSVVALVLDLFRRIVEHCQRHRPHRSYFEASNFALGTPQFPPQSSQQNMNPARRDHQDETAHVRILCPGIVLIDEVDAHLHPAWQRYIGFWLKAHFPGIQFLVTTHSPYICQAAEEDGLIRLSSPAERSGTLNIIEGTERFTILNGEADETALSSLFGLSRTHSDPSERLRQEAAALEARLLRRQEQKGDIARFEALMDILPASLRGELEGLLQRAKSRSGHQP